MAIWGRRVMDITEFHAALWNEVNAQAAAHGELTRTAFVEVTAGRLMGAEDVQDWRPAFFSRKAARGPLVEIDGYSDDELESAGVLTVFVALIKGDGEVQTIKSDELKRQYEAGVAFVAKSLTGEADSDEFADTSHPARDLVRIIRASEESARLRGTEPLQRVRICILTDAVMGARTKHAQRQAIGDITYEQHIWDLERLHRLELGSGTEPVEFITSEHGVRGIPAIPASREGAGYEAYLCVMPGSLLADIYDLYGTRLLESNIRAFLSTKVSANKGMRKTIISEPTKFFAFNNGLTATATAVERAPDGSITRLAGLQIVNGGQTTATLHSTRAKDRADLSHVFVQMKLTVLPADQATDLVPDIAKFANTQSKVSEADLASTSHLHRKIEELSRRIAAPARAGSTVSTYWYYERARAQYQTDLGRLSPAEQKKFIMLRPRAQVITKTDLAKIEATWRGRPYETSLGAQKNFIKFAVAFEREFAEHEEHLNERWFKHLVAKTILFETLDVLVAKAPWYAQFKANVVAYALAKLVAMASELRCEVDLDSIWKMQVVPDALKAQLSVIAEAVNGVVTSPPPERRNVTEWAKRQECWQRVQDLSVEFSPAARRCLRALSEVRGELRDARRDERENMSIHAQTACLNKAEEGYWASALAWRDARRVLGGGGTMYNILKTAAERGKTFVPTEKQAQRLLEIAAKLEKEGFVFVPGR